MNRRGGLSGGTRRNRCLTFQLLETLPSIQFTVRWALEPLWADLDGRRATAKELAMMEWS